MFSGLLVSAQPAELLKKAGTAKEYPNAGYILVYDSTRVDVQESGLSYYNSSRLFKILTPSGAKEIATIKLDYDPLTAFIRIEKVRIIRNSGKIEVLDKSKFYDYPAPARAIYWGARQKMIDIGRLDAGDGGNDAGGVAPVFGFAIKYKAPAPNKSTKSILLFFIATH